MGVMKSSLKTTNTSTSRLIDKQLKLDEKRMKKEVKLLLLGKYLFCLLMTKN